MSTHLPSDIAENIFFRLPAKSLSRLSLVCKEWRLLISDPSFVKDHTNRALSDQSNHHHKVIFNRESKEYDYPIISESVDDASANHTAFEFHFRNLFRPGSYRPVPKILGSCNGLLLIDIDFHSYAILCNPLFPDKFKFLNWPSYCLFCGFGYVSSVDDFKVVCCKPDFSEVGICSVKSNSWKTLLDVPSSRLECRRGRYCCRWEDTGWGTHGGGSIYWIRHDNYGDNSYRIFALDLQTEKFKLIETPYDGWYKLLDVRGCLGVYQGGVIWKWNEDENKKGYWTKYLRIRNKCISIIKVLSIMNDNKILLHVDKDNSDEELVVYDLACKTIRRITRAKVHEPVHMLETLVPVPD